MQTLIFHTGSIIGNNVVTSLEEHCGLLLKQSKCTCIYTCICTNTDRPTDREIETNTHASPTYTVVNTFTHTHTCYLQLCCMPLCVCLSLLVCVIYIYIYIYICMCMFVYFSFYTSRSQALKLNRGEFFPRIKMPPLIVSTHYIINTSYNIRCFPLQPILYIWRVFHLPFHLIATFKCYNANIYVIRVEN